MTLKPGREEVRYALDRGAGVQHGENRGMVWKAKEPLKQTRTQFGRRNHSFPAFVWEAPALRGIDSPVAGLGPPQGASVLTSITSAPDLIANRVSDEKMEQLRGMPGVLWASDLCHVGQGGSSLSHSAVRLFVSL